MLHNLAHVLRDSGGASCASCTTAELLGVGEGRLLTCEPAGKSARDAPSALQAASAAICSLGSSPPPAVRRRSPPPPFARRRMSVGRDDTLTVPGLRNLGNTCYLNAALQVRPPGTCLCAAPPACREVHQLACCIACSRLTTSTLSPSNARAPLVSGPGLVPCAAASSGGSSGPARACSCRRRRLCRPAEPGAVGGPARVPALAAAARLCCPAQRDASPPGGRVSPAAAARGAVGRCELGARPGRSCWLACWCVCAWAASARRAHPHLTRPALPRSLPPCRRGA